MSGVTLTPLQIQRNRVRSLQNQLANQQSRHKRMQRNAAEQERNWNKQMRALSGVIKAQQKQHDIALGQLRSDLGGMERRHQKSLRHLEDSFNESLQHQEQRLNQRIDQLHEWTIEELDQQRNEFLEITSGQQKQINSINEELGEIRSKELAKKETVLSRMEDLRILIRNVDELPHHKYAPGELQKIGQKLNRAANDLDQMPESANTMVLDAYQELVELRGRVESAQRKFEVLHAQTLILLELLLDELKEDKVEVDQKQWNIDYWTDDEYQELEARGKALKKKIIRSKDDMRYEDLEKMQAEIKGIETKKNKVIDQAIQKILAARERRNMGIKVAKSLNNDFNIIDGNGFEDGDPRKSYIVKVKSSNHSGATELVAIIAPEKNSSGEIQNILAISSTDHFQDQEARRLRSEKVATSLKTEGIHVGETICEHDDHIHELEGGAVRKIVRKGSGGLSSQVKQQLKIK